MHNRRKTIVINKKFQHHYAIVLVAMTVLVANLIIIAGMVLPGEQRLHLSSSSGLFIGLVELLLVAGVWFLSLRSTHRIAGPIYVYSRQLRAFGGGDLTARIHLREKDMFQDEAAEINGGLEQLHATVVELKSLFIEVQAEQSRGGDLSQSLDRLAGALDQLTTEARS
jgi:methyl-accepting chemotaxis protein